MAGRMTAAAMAVLGMLAAAGCGPAAPPASVQGRVTFTGQPVGEGTIRFYPRPGTPGRGTGARITTGSFQVPADAGLVAGEYVVEVRAWRPTGRRSQPIADVGPDGTVLAAATGPIEDVEEYLPAASGGDRELSVRLEPGGNELDLQLPRGRGASDGE